MTHYFIDTLLSYTGDANARDHWFKSRQGRARACEKFGIDTCIVQGAQQSHQKPSSKVLAYALCAIIGAVWLDMEKQNESALSTREQVFGILRRIDDAMEDTTEGHRSTTGESTSSASEGNEGIQRCILGGASEVIEPNQLSDEDIVQADAFMFQWFEQTQHEIFWSMDPALFSFHSMQPETNIVPLSEFQSTLYSPISSTIANVPKAYVKATGILNSDLSAIGHISNGIALPGSGGEMEHSEQRIQTGSGRIDDAPQGYSNASENAQTAVRPAKRKYSHDHCGRLRSSSLQPDLLHDELGKLNSFPVSIRSHLEALVDDPRIGDLGTDPSQVKQLRLFYFAIGSCQSLIEFKENLRAARSMPSGSIHSFGANLCLTERVREICRLDDQEALCVLARRYHIVKLFETELETLRQNNEMIMETPSTFGTTLRAQPGNPVMMQEAALTDGLICRIKPGLKKGTKEFQKFRAKLSQLRRLAKVLRMLTQTYGFGILALLPCGPSYSELAITDRT